ncbi:PucR family transcriptional regulator [Actinomadura craniellae]|uniref:PucR family transcriptional regulator n=1 Tax=Actinomadura craniellae TaxID=2231787 RepID=A0A365HCD5_9ACTN|nr:PucR family transcriptional regulator [Actinomadura craniellae]RAY16761.1 PucR family transcriptional regulator [Actinomadura craniellae]
MFEPWNDAVGLGPAGLEVTALLYPELPSLAAEVVEEIRDQIPEYAAPLKGALCEPVRARIEKGLHQLLTRFIAGSPIESQSSEFYRALGRGEFLESRSLDSLQAAYRISARVTWRRFARIGHEADIASDLMYLLADSVFTFSDEMTALSVGAFTELSVQTAGTLEHARQQLLRRLLTEPAHSLRTRLAELSLKARWPLPETVTCVAISEDYDAPHVISPALDPDILADLKRSDPCLLVPGFPSPARFHSLHREFTGVAFALGATVPLEETARSLAMARQALTLRSQGLLSGEHLRCEDHLATMYLLSDDLCLQVLRRRALAPFAALNAKQRDRLCETLLVWIDSGNSVVKAAARLHVHPQTVRNRMRQLGDLFPGLLDDPDWRFEIQLALRSRRLTFRRRRPKQRKHLHRRQQPTATAQAVR